MKFEVKLVNNFGYTGVVRLKHWQVLQFMREFYEQRQVAADARFVIKHLTEDLGGGTAARNQLFEPFPYGYVKQACKIAGMRRPRSWGTG